MTRGGKMGTKAEFEQGLSVRWKSGGGDSVVRFRSATESLAEWQKVMQKCTFHTLDCFEFLAECKQRDIPENAIYPADLENMRKWIAWAYAKGYNAGQNGRWPYHKPPQPPNEIVARLMKALHDLRDTTDGLCATLDETDEFVILLNPKIDEATNAIEAVTEWLKTQPA